MTEGNGAPFRPAPPILVTAVIIVVLLSAAAVVAMLLPSGDQGQSQDAGNNVEIPPPPSPVVNLKVVRAQASASWRPDEQGSADVLECAFTLEGVPPSRSSVVHVLLTGDGVAPVPLLHPGEAAVDGVVQSVQSEPETFSVTQTLPDATGDYTCELASVMTADGASRLEGRTRVTTTAPSG